MSEKNQLSVKNSGYTLIELLVALAVGSIVMAAIGSAFWIQTQTSRDQQLVVAMQQNLRAAMYMLERDIMMAGYDNDRSDPPAATIIDATPFRFEFQFIDDTNTQRTVEYTLYDALGDGDLDIGRSFDGAPRAAIAENIESIEFFYTLNDGTQTITPADPADVRAVGISILARTGGPVRSIDSQVYTSLSGDSIGPFNDNIARQIATATIICRNMG